MRINSDYVASGKLSKHYNIIKNQFYINNEYIRMTCPCVYRLSFSRF